MQDKLRQIVQAFVDEKIGHDELRRECEVLLKAGLRSHLSEGQKKPILNFITWWVEFYDPKYPPYLGLFGKIRNLYAQMNGQYRIDRESMFAEARKVLRILAKYGP